MLVRYDKATGALRLMATLQTSRYLDIVLLHRAANPKGADSDALSGPLLAILKGCHPIPSSTARSVGGDGRGCYAIAPSPALGWSAPLVATRSPNFLAVRGAV